MGELSRLDGGALLLAALDAAPEFVRAEACRRLPGLGSDRGGMGGQDGGWRLERLFAAVAELLAAAAGLAGAGVGLVVDVGRSAIPVVAQSDGQPSRIFIHRRAWGEHPQLPPTG